MFGIPAISTCAWEDCIFPPPFYAALKSKFQRIYNGQITGEVGGRVNKFMKDSHNMISRLTKTTIKVAWNRQKDKLYNVNRIEQSLDIGPPVYGQMIFNKVTKII